MNKNFLPKLFWDFRHSFPFSWHTESAWDYDESQVMGLSISEDKECIVFEAAFPGVSPEKIEISLDNGRLSIKGCREESKEKKYHRKGNISFYYSAAIPGYADMEKEPNATHRHGLLTVRIFKVEKRKSIPIKLMDDEDSLPFSPILNHIDD